MVTSQDFYNKYGEPSSKNLNLIMWDVPNELELGVIPKKLWCNKDMPQHLEKAFRNIIDRGLIDQLKTWDGCVNIRPIRGYETKYKNAIKAGNKQLAMKYMSVHSWGCAIDINQFENQLGHKPLMSQELVQCFKDAGFDWGGDWKRLDGMHFQLSKI